MFLAEVLPLFRANQLGDGAGAGRGPAAQEPRISIAKHLLAACACANAMAKHHPPYPP